MENAWKVSKRIRRIRGKYLSVYGEHDKSSPNTRKVFKHIRRMRGKNLCIIGEDAKRILAYSPYTPKDIKVCISWLIIIQLKKILDSFYLNYMGWIKPKNHLTLLSL